MQLPGGTPWRDWTPAVSQGAAITTTVTYAKYRTLGKVAFVNARLAFTSAGTGGSSIQIAGLPSAIEMILGGDGDLVGTFYFQDTGTAHYFGGVRPNGTTGLRFVTNTATNNFGANPAVTIANGDTMGLNLVYRIA